jgi:uracil-DNA glycosylase
MMDSLVLRVASRYSREVLAWGGHERVLPSREHYLPPEALSEKPLYPEGTDLEIWTWDGTRNTNQGEKKVFYGAAFAGKSNKPLWHYAFATQSNRIEEIRKTIEIRKQYIDRKKEQQQERSDFVHGLKPGDIMVCSWGYDQTNIDFYQIVEVRGKNVVIREIASKIVGHEGAPQEEVMPVPNHFVGEPMVKRPGGSSGRPSVKVHSFASAHLWDGKPEHQTGGGYALRAEFRKDYFNGIVAFVETERRSTKVYPPSGEIFTAFDLTPFDAVRVVILGQDPYFRPGQAHGLAFSVRPGVDVPPSLRNIFKELEDDLGCKPPGHGNLTQWAKQGIFLLNTTLTVCDGSPGSHMGHGWETFTDAVIRALVARETPTVFILWGSPAKGKKGLIPVDRHRIIESSHPSPQSAYAGFFGSKPFSKANSFLKETGLPEIDWQLT